METLEVSAYAIVILLLPGIILCIIMIIKLQVDYHFILTIYQLKILSEIPFVVTIRDTTGQCYPFAPDGNFV